MLNRTHIAEVDFLRALLNASQEALIVIAKDGTIIYASPGVESLYGRHPDELVGCQAAHVIAGPDDEQLKRTLARMVYTKVRRTELTVRIPGPNDSLRTVRFEIVNEHGNPSLDAFLFIVRDITAATLTEQQLQHRTKLEALVSRTSARFANSSMDETERDLHESLAELCEVTGIERAMLWVVDDFGRMFTPETELHAPNIAGLDGRTPALPLMVAKNHAPELWDGSWITATRANAYAPLLEAVEIADLTPIQQITFVPMRVAGNIIGLLSLNAPAVDNVWDESTRSLVDTVTSIFGNALNRRTVERALAFQALHDPLTGLPNRSLLLDRLSTALARSARTNDNVCVMLIDLDGFKDVNDTLGHAAGDELLRVVSRRLVETLRDADSVARLGGDEFVIVAETATDELNARIVAGRILEVLRQPVRIGKTEVVVSGSVGLVIANASHDRTLDANALLRKADIAMYRAKTGGRDRVETFSDEMEDRIRKRFEMLEDLRRAVNEDELDAWYQPIIDVASGRLSSYEALVRWNHPERGLLMPIDFIELAEGSGLVHELGAIMLTKAVSQLAEWRGSGQVDDNVTMSVNVSVRQLLSMTFVDTVRDTLARFNLPAALLHLELTESIFADRHLVTGPLLRLREIGVGVSIDDFGTGYSSLSYLRDLPIDTLKIDRSFVQGLGSDRRDSALVGAVVGMATELGLNVVAEGVETQEQFAQLERLGCSQAQGYLFGRPASAGSINADSIALTREAARQNSLRS